MKESSAALKLAVFERCLVWLVAVAVVVAVAAATLITEDILRWQACDKKELAQWMSDDAAHKNDGHNGHAGSASKLSNQFHRPGQCL